MSYTAWFIKAKPAGRYAALTNQAVHDGPESGDGEGTAKAALASGRAQAQGLTTAGATNYWIACQASGVHFLDISAPICERSPKLLCTEAAKDNKIIEWATQRSASGFIPDIFFEISLRE